MLFGRHFALHMLNVTIGVGSKGSIQLRVSSFSSGEAYYSIVMLSIGSLSTGLSTFPSGECNNAILQYFYGFNI